MARRLAARLAPVPSIGPKGYHGSSACTPCPGWSDPAAPSLQRSHLMNAHTELSMWARAVALLEEAEQRHRRFFELLGTAPARQPVWEPPVDMFLAEGELHVVVAIPAVRPEDIHLQVGGGELLVRAESRLPVPPGRSRILRLEIPYGCIERRIELPPGAFELKAHEFRDGCLRIRLAGEWQ